MHYPSRKKLSINNSTRISKSTYYEGIEYFVTGATKQVCGEKIDEISNWAVHQQLMYSRGSQLEFSKKKEKKNDSQANVHEIPS